MSIVIPKFCPVFFSSQEMHKRQQIKSAFFSPSTKHHMFLENERVPTFKDEYRIFDFSVVEFVTRGTYRNKYFQCRKPF